MDKKYSNGYHTVKVCEMSLGQFVLMKDNQAIILGTSFDAPGYSCYSDDLLGCLAGSFWIEKDRFDKEYKEVKNEGQ